MTQLARAEFLGTPVSILDHAGRLWLTARDVGRCLGYAEDHARHAILKLFTRHEDEFGPEDTGVVNLTTPGGEQQTRIFSQTGCILLAMFANTARAKDFRAWAKRVLAREAQAAPAGPRFALKPPKITRRIERLVLEAYVEGRETKKQIARRLGISEPAVVMLLRGTYPFSPGAGEDETTPELREAVAARKIAWQAENLARACASRANLALQSAHERRAGPMLAALERVAGIELPPETRALIEEA